jgi:hypothetical protein
MRLGIEMATQALSVIMGRTIHALADMGCATAIIAKEACLSIR